MVPVLGEGATPEQQHLVLESDKTCEVASAHVVPSTGLYPLDGIKRS